jgi:hypothetical protein
MLAACGGDAMGYTEPCREWLESMECGSFDFEAHYDCDRFEEFTCDYRDYLDCISDGGTCDEAAGVWTQPDDCHLPSCEE